MGSNKLSTVGFISIADALFATGCQFAVPVSVPSPRTLHSAFGRAGASGAGGNGVAGRVAAPSAGGVAADSGGAGKGSGKAGAALDDGGTSAGGATAGRGAWGGGVAPPSMSGMTSATSTPGMNSRSWSQMVALQIVTSFFVRPMRASRTKTDDSSSRALASSSADLSVPAAPAAIS